MENFFLKIGDSDPRWTGDQRLVFEERLAVIADGNGRPLGFTYAEFAIARKAADESVPGFVGARQKRGFLNLWVDWLLETKQRIPPWGFQGPVRLKES